MVFNMFWPQKSIGAHPSPPPLQRLHGSVRLSAAFKNALTERRMAVRIAVQVHAQALEEGRVEQANLADGYKTRVETLGYKDGHVI